MKEFHNLIELPWSGEGNPYGELTEKQWNILKAALVVFTEKGYSAATTSEIARMAGVAEGTIFRHFKTKKEILLATIVPLMQNLLGPGAANSLRQLLIENETLPVEEVLLIILEDRQKHIMKALPLLKIIFIESNFHPELRHVLVKGVAGPSQEFFLRFIEQRQKSGELRADLDAWTLARSLVGAFAFYLISCSLFKEHEERKESRKELRGIIEIFIKGSKR